MFQIENFLKIRKQIPQHITLTVVCKKQIMENIGHIVNLQHTDFAENYVQEAKEKWQNINNNINLKLIGHLQSNKIKDALEIFSEIHTVDSLQKAEKIAKAIDAQSKTKRFYIQVNIGMEAQKHGVDPENVLYCVQNSPIEISGFMCIPPANISPELFFRQMNIIRNNCQQRCGKKFLLSMGMSGDFQSAIEYGSDEIRVGSAIFGERQ